MRSRIYYDGGIYTASGRWVPVGTNEWGPVEIMVPTTRCKHGWGSCQRCGTSDERDVVHSRRAPTKKEARRQRKKGKR